MDGFILIDKPAGMSSFGVVARVRRLISQELGHKVKVGHTGTLDPAASGLMIIVVGKYCKKAALFSKLDKTYEAELTLGAVSSTGDSEGEITTQSGKRPSKEEVKRILNGFHGEIMQTPPAYSAIKVDGQRAYKLARAGKEVALEPRKIVIQSIENVDYEYPRLRLVTTVSSGTYIRSLAEDIGLHLGVGAYLSKLKRTSINGFLLSDAAGLDGLTINVIQAGLKQGLPSPRQSATI